MQCPSCDEDSTLILRITPAYAAPHIAQRWDAVEACPVCLLATLLRAATDAQVERAARTADQERRN